MNDFISIRAHHGMCLSYFKGIGYNDEFTQNMTTITRLLKENPRIKIITHSDIICRKCPNLMSSGICATESKIRLYDQRVLEFCNLKDNSILSWNVFHSIILDKILNTGLREKICSSCQWTSLCK